MAASFLATIPFQATYFLHHHSVFTRSDSNKQARIRKEEQGSIINIILTMFGQILLGCALAYIVWTFACLESNVRKARNLKVPIVRLPIDSNNVFWILLQPYVWKFLSCLPFSWSSYPRFLRYSRRGWYFAERAEAHVHLGPVWALVSPMAINLHFADPDTIRDILTRRGDFQRLTKELSKLPRKRDRGNLLTRYRAFGALRPMHLDG